MKVLISIFSAVLAALIVLATLSFYIDKTIKEEPVIKIPIEVPKNTIPCKCECKPKIIYKEKIVYKEKIKKIVTEKIVYKTTKLEKDRVKFGIFGVIGGNPNRLKITEDTEHYLIKHSYIPIFGIGFKLQYKNYFGQTSLLSNSCFLFGLGYDF